MFRIGIVGAGAIGKEIARAIDNGMVPAKLEAIWDRDENEAAEFAASLKSKPRVLPLKELVEALELCGRGRVRGSGTRGRHRGADAGTEHHGHERRRIRGQ